MTTGHTKSTKITCERVERGSTESPQIIPTSLVSLLILPEAGRGITAVASMAVEATVDVHHYRKTPTEALLPYNTLPKTRVSSDTIQQSAPHYPELTHFIHPADSSKRACPCWGHLCNLKRDREHFNTV